MHYKFPVIQHINDVLPAVKDREEFAVTERDFGTVINYMVAFPDTFKMEGPDDLTGAICRECRGLKFYPDGKIGARPFHKWFNINERDETQQYVINLSSLHSIMEKLDGSMIHPMKVGGAIRWMSKMGITDVALQAEEFVYANPKYQDFASWCVGNQLTPLFEWCSRKQKIVIDYPEDKLVLLAVRNNITGEYLSIRP